MEPIKKEGLQTLKFKTNINCGGCVAKVTNPLNEIEGICHWEVDTTNKDKILTVEVDNVQAAEIINSIEDIGFDIEIISA